MLDGVEVGCLENCRYPRFLMSIRALAITRTAIGRIRMGMLTLDTPTPRPTIPVRGMAATARVTGPLRVGAEWRDALRSSELAGAEARMSRRQRGTRRAQ